MTKRPSLQFYPGDWRRDAALQSCSMGARGLWMEMICLMHDGYPYGYLRAGQKVIQVLLLARMTGCEIDDCEVWVTELEEAKVFSRAEDGAIFSRRLVRDEDLRDKRVAAGKKGGNPALKKSGSKNQKDKPKVKQKDKQSVADAVCSMQNLLSLLISEWNARDLGTVKPETILNPTSASGKKRRAAALARLKEHPDIEEWRIVIDRIAARPWCRGENDSGWTADFEYLCRPDTFDAHFGGKFSRSDKPRRNTTNPDVRAGATQEPKKKTTERLRLEALMLALTKYTRAARLAAKAGNATDEQAAILCNLADAIEEVNASGKPDVDDWYALHDEASAALWSSLERDEQLELYGKPDNRVKKETWCRKKIEKRFGLPVPHEATLEDLGITGA